VAKITDDERQLLEQRLQPVSKVAEFLCLSRSKVYGLMEQGELPFVKLGKSRRVRWSDVLKLVEANTVSKDGANT
jgi:excisionase family DNA binding protein